MERPLEGLAPDSGLQATGTGARSLTAGSLDHPAVRLPKRLPWQGQSQLFSAVFQ